MKNIKVIIRLVQEERQLGLELIVRERTIGALFAFFPIHNGIDNRTIIDSIHIFFCDGCLLFGE